MLLLSIQRRLLVGILFTLGVVGQVGAEEKKIVLTGSSTVAPLAAEIGKRFEKLNPGIRVDVQSGGSSRGITDARSGVADIGMASRPLKVEENDLFHFSIATDGVGIIVHQKNPIKKLSDEQIKAIFTGKISNWKEVGGEDKKITVVNKAEGRSTLELFLHYFQLKNTEIRAHVVIGDNQQGIKTVAGNPGAIGYVSIGTAEYEEAHKTPIRLMPMAEIAASTANVRDGRFPLSRPLNFVTKAKPVGVVKQFIEFAQSKAVDDLVQEQYFVPLAH